MTPTEFRIVFEALRIGVESNNPSWRHQVARLGRSLEKSGDRTQSQQIYTLLNSAEAVEEKRWLRDIFHRDQALFEAYNDECKLLEYGTTVPSRIERAIKEYHRRTRRWTFNGTHWFGKPWPDEKP